jgi:hypothetical protein
MSEQVLVRHTGRQLRYREVALLSIKSAAGKFDPAFTNQIL